MLQLTIRTNGLPSPKPGAWSTLLPKFQQRAAELLLAHVQAHLGEDDLYALSEAYAARKPRLPGYNHIAGKPTEQPLILSGELFHNIVVLRQGSTLLLEIKPGEAIDERDGFAYGEFWESRLHFLEMAVAEIADDLAGLLGDLIAETLFT